MFVYWRCTVFRYGNCPRSNEIRFTVNMRYDLKNTNPEIVKYYTGKTNPVQKAYGRRRYNILSNSYSIMKYFRYFNYYR